LAASLIFVYFEDEPGRRSAAKQLTKDGARRIAANIAKLPGLLNRQRTAYGRRSATPYLYVVELVFRDAPD
jgi:hypothetical protein